MDDVSSGLGNRPDRKQYALSGKIMLSAIVILFFVLVLMVALHLYARWYLLQARRRQLLRRRSRLNHARRTQIVFYVDNDPTSLIASDPANRMLEPAVLNSLPHFVYSPKTHPKVMDCAVCLSEFEENEIGRILPKCKHSFHIECIDMWFHSHSTCPLCRAPVEKFSEAHENSNSDVIINLGGPESSRTEPGSSIPELFSACKHEDGDTATSSLGVRRKGIDFTGVRIEIPMRNELENELTLSSPANQAFRSPGTRLLSLKRLLSMGRKTPNTPPTGTAATPCGAGTSCGMSTREIELERGTTESTRDLTPR